MGAYFSFLGYFLFFFPATKRKESTSKHQKHQKTNKQTNKGLNQL